MIFSTLNSPTGYYVYLYLREDGTPYYVGKGHGKRAWTKGQGEVYPPTELWRIVIAEHNLTNIGALAIERRLIRWYRRKDTDYEDGVEGILRNKTDGGDGVTNPDLTTPNQKKRLLNTSKHQRQLVKLGKHPLQGDAGRKLIEGQIANGTHAGTKVFATHHVCPNCGKTGKGAVMYKHHYNNCKSLKNSPKTHKKVA